MINLYNLPPPPFFLTNINTFNINTFNINIYILNVLKYFKIFQNWHR